MSDPRSPRSGPRATLRALLVVGPWGEATTVVAYLVLGGSLGVFAAATVIIGIAQRIAAVAIVRRRSGRPARWREI